MEDKMSIMIVPEMKIKAASGNFCWCKLGCWVGWGVGGGAVVGGWGGGGG